MKVYSKCVSFQRNISFLIVMYFSIKKENTQMAENSRKNEHFELGKIAIIAILAAILLPALNSARQRGLAADCLSRHKQSVFAQLSYADNFDGYLSEATLWASKLYSQGFFGSDPDTADPENKEVYRCPAIGHTRASGRWRDRTFGMRYDYTYTGGYHLAQIPLKTIGSTSTVMAISDSAKTDIFSQLRLI